MAYADYAFYSSTYLGTAIASADFPRLAARASAVIDRITFGRAAAVITAETPAATVTAIKNAVCAVADEIQKSEASGGAVQSERVGNYSVTYLSQKSDEKRQIDAAALYLWNTDLMYRGFTEGELSEQDTP